MLLHKVKDKFQMNWVLFLLIVQGRSWLNVYFKRTSFDARIVYEFRFRKMVSCEIWNADTLPQINFFCRWQTNFWSEQKVIWRSWKEPLCASQKLQLRSNSKSPQRNLIDFLESILFLMKTSKWLLIVKNATNLFWYVPGGPLRIT